MQKVLEDIKTCTVQHTVSITSFNSPVLSIIQLHSDFMKWEVDSVSHVLKNDNKISSTLVNTHIPTHHHHIITTCCDPSIDLNYSSNNNYSKNISDIKKGEAKKVQVTERLKSVKSLWGQEEKIYQQGRVELQHTKQVK